MGLKTKKSADAKLNSFWREVVLSDDAPPAQPSPTHEEIQRRAYEIYLSRRAADRHDLKDWFQAERELRPANGDTAPLQH